MMASFGPAALLLGILVHPVPLPLAEVFLVLSGLAIFWTYPLGLATVFAGVRAAIYVHKVGAPSALAWWSVALGLLALAYPVVWFWWIGYLVKLHNVSFFVH
jgi:hypothetical protein